MPLINRYNTTIKGAMTFIGNTAGLSQLPNTNQAGTLGSIGAFTSLNTALQVPTFPAGTTLNYLQNGSAANLTLPIGSIVIYAELIWGGNYYYNYVDTANPPPVSQNIFSVLSNPVLFNGQPVLPDPATAQEQTFSQTSGTLTVTRGFYERSADVTAIVQAAGAGSYTCQQIPGLVEPVQNYTGATNHAGWTLAVMYQDLSLPERTLYLYNGAQLIINTIAPTIDIPIAGFATKPSGPINARLLVSAQEGDADIPNDFIQFGPTAATLTQLSGPNNPINNFFGSQINNSVGVLDTSGTFGTRNQNPFTQTNIVGGRQGWDITNLDVSSYMQNNQTAAVVRIGTTQDAYMINALGLQIDALVLDTSVVKTADVAYADVGDTITYTITVTNHGNGLASNMILTDTDPQGTAFIPGSVLVNGVPNVGANPNTGIPVGTLGLGASVTVQYQVQVTSVPAQNPVLNQASIVYNFSPTQTTTDTSNTVSTQINHASIVPVKSVNTAYAQRGTTISYTTQLTNTGSAPANNVVFTDVPPAGTSFVPNSVVIGGVPAPGENPALGIAIGTILPGNTISVRFDVTLPAGFPTPNPVPNTSQVSYEYTEDPAEPPVVVPSVISNIVTTQVNEAVLAAVKSVDKTTAAFGDTVTYTTVLSNLGNVTATNVVFLDGIPTGMTFVAGSVIVDGVAQPAADPEIGFAVNNIPAGGTRTVSFKVTVNASLPLINPIQNKSGADFSFLVDPAAPAVQGTPIVSNTVTTQINDSILSATKSVNLAYADVGSTLIYTVTVNNTGNISATGVVFTDVPPAGTTFVPGSVIVNGGAVPAANPVTGFTLPSIAAGGTATVSFQASVNGTLPLPTLVSNTATVKAPGKTAVVSNAVVTQIRHAQLTAQKQTDTANTDLGAIINYTITLTNVGNTTAQGITFVDAIPSGTSFIGNSVLINGIQQVGANPALGVSIPAMAAGATTTISFKVQVQSTLPITNPIENSGTASYTYLVDPTNPPVSAPAVVTNLVESNVRTARITCVKTVDKTLADTGEQLLYSVTLTNNGTVAASNLVFNDGIPSGTTLVPNSVTVGGTPQPGADPSVGVPIATLAAGASVVVAFRVQIGNTVPNPNPILNQSATTYQYLVDPGGSPVTAPPSTSNTVSTQVNHAQIMTTKAVSVTIATLGDTFTYTVLATNVGSVNAENVVLKDIVPNGCSFVPGSVTIDAVAQPGADPGAGISIGILPPNQTVTVQFQAIIGGTLPVPNPMLNTADITYQYHVNPAGPIVTAPTRTTNEVQTLVVEQNDVANLSILKTVSRTYATFGDTLHYSLAISCTGNTNALNVTVTDTLATGITFTPGSVYVDSVHQPLADIESGVPIPVIAPAQTVIVEFDAVVDNFLPPINPIHNHANATYQFRNDPDLPPIDGPTVISNTVTTHIVAVSLIAQKAVDLAYADITSVLQYTITVTNDGTASTQNVTLTDIVPLGATFLAGTVQINGITQPGADPASGINIGALAPNDVVFIAFKAQVSGAIPTTNPLVNTADFTYEYFIDPLDPPYTGTPFTTNPVTTEIRHAEILLTKSADTTIADLGQTIRYNVLVENLGNVAASTVVVIDNIPTGTSFIPGSVRINSNPQPAMNPVTGITIPSVGAGGSATITFDVAVGNSIPAVNPVTDTANSTYTYLVSPNGTPVSASSLPSNEVSVEIRHGALTVVKQQSSQYVDIGNEITYTITLTNVGNTAVNSIILTDVPPDGSSFVPGSVTVGGGSVPGASPLVGIPVPSIPAEGSLIVTFRTHVDFIPDPNTLTNAANTTYYYTVDPLDLPVAAQAASNAVTAFVNHAQISALKSVNKAYETVNGTLIYTIILTNTGSTPAENVVLTDPVPAGTTFVSGSVFVNGVQKPLADPATGILVGSIGAGLSAVVSFSVKIGASLPTPNPIVNIATIAYAYFVDPQSQNPVIAPPVTSNPSTTLINVAELHSEKSVNAAYADLQDVLIYTIQITNSGNATASNAVFTDTVPPGTTFVSGSVTINTAPVPGADPQAGILLPDIAAGATATVTFSVKVNNSLPPINPLNNSSDTTYQYLVSPNGPTAIGTPSHSNHVTTQVNSGQLTVIKSVDSIYKDLGSSVLYTFTISNIGNQTSSVVVLNDLLEPETLFTTGTVVVNGIPQPAMDPNTGITVGNIAPGTTVTVTFQAEVVALPAQNPVPNTGTLHYQYPVNPQMPPKQATQVSNTTQINILHAEILPQNVVKSANRTATIEGDIITYSVSITNSGNVSADFVLVQDVASPGVTFVPDSVVVNGVSMPGENPFTGIHAGTIAAGSTVIASYKLLVGANAPSKIIDTVYVTYSYTVDPAAPPVTVTTPSNPVTVNHIVPKVSLVKSADKTVAAVGDTVTYTLLATNTGDIDLTNVLIQDLLDSALDFVEGSVTLDGVSLPTANLLSGFSIGPLAMAAAKTITFKAKVVANPGTLIPNQASALIFFRLGPNDPERSKDQYSNVVEIAIQNPSLLIVKQSDVTETSLDGMIHYHVTLLNTGDTVLTHVIFYDHLSSATRLVDDSVTINGTVVHSVDLASGIDVGTMAVGAHIDILYAVQVISGSCDGMIVNEAYARYSYELEDGSAGTGVTQPVSVSVATSISNFKQLSIGTKLHLPCAKPDIETIGDVDATISIQDSYVIETAPSVSNERQRLNGYKLIVHGTAEIILEYTALLPDQSLHSAHWSVPFTTFVIMPVDYTADMQLEVSAVLEDVDGILLNPRCIEASVVLLVFAKRK